MKKFLLACLALVLSLHAFTQKFEELDESPMDMAYFPDNFSHDRKFAPKKIGGLPAIIRVIYSRPSKKGRVIFGKIVPYSKVWRTGANEATEIKLYQDVSINGKPVQAGTYTLFTIPSETEWTIIINKDLDHWGDYSYNENNDVLRVTVPSKKSNNIIENFSIRLMAGKEREAIMLMGWENTWVEVPISY